MGGKNSHKLCSLQADSRVEHINIIIIIIITKVANLEKMFLLEKKTVLACHENITKL